MKITNSETRILFRDKVSNGKSESQAIKEIFADKLFLEYSRRRDNEISKLNTIIKKQNEQIARLKENIKKIKAKKFKETFRKLGQVPGEYASTKDLSRILSLLESEKQIKLGDLRQTCIIQSSTKFRNALQFLEHLNLIEQVPQGKFILIKLKDKKDIKWW